MTAAQDLWRDELLTAVHADETLLPSFTLAQITEAVTLAVDFAAAKVAEAKSSRRRRTHCRFYGSPRPWCGSNGALTLTADLSAVDCRGCLNALAKRADVLRRVAV